MLKKIMVIFLTLSLIFSCEKIKKLKNELENLQIENIDLTLVKDGAYEGECNLEIVTAKVKVTVESGKITNIEIIEHKHGPGYGADKIREKIMEKQSLEVDVISGATGSSKVILKAVENALKKVYNTFKSFKNYYI